MYGWRPLKFRIEAFVNGFIDLVSFLLWLAEFYFFGSRLTDRRFLFRLNHVFLLEPFARSLAVKFWFSLAGPSPSTLPDDPGPPDRPPD